MFKHVLVPLDFPTSPTITLRTAAQLASEQNAKVTLLYVFDLSRDFVVAAFTPISESDVAGRKLEVQRWLDNATAELAQHGVTASALIVDGSPVSFVINDCASKIRADVIVMRTHGRHGLAHAWVGSVTEEVLRDAAVPVLVVHEPSNVTQRAS